MVKMSIDTGNHPTIKLRPYRTPFAKHPIVDKAVNYMLAANIIHPSKSFPTVVADKKDGNKKFCTDNRKLNNISKKSSWLFPVIDEMLAALGKAKYFTSTQLILLTELQLVLQTSFHLASG